ncbi:zinc-ribbon domain-containing protein [Methylobacterium sp.]|jgi:predicted Zn finger-like uncharacterized protein|uniref:zinc-ribbon domain-containing protein n=1 Tax=Methylobacterium sp. TaxID=409 RepID=UPI00261EEC4A|nr:zinc-ribbon domain-containing protein [Methylobacterium sp.]MDB5647392.1 hypothetical protein [Methylobacterium sp.]
MLIVCPSCASEYQIDLDRVGSEGRSVRCAACRETWFISPDDVSAALEAEMTAAMMAASEVGPDAAESRASAQADLDAWEAALEAEPEPSPAAVEAPPQSPRVRGKPKPVKAKGRASALASPGTALALALVAGLGFAVLARASVVRMMPQSAGLYARIGLPVNLRGLDLRDVVAFQTPGEGAQGQLVVEGDLVGVAQAGAQVPPMEVEVRDGRDQPLYRWQIAPPRPSLEKGEIARFRASLSAPPAQGRSVRVHFAAAVSETTAKGDVSAQRP